MTDANETGAAQDKPNEQMRTPSDKWPCVAIRQIYVAEATDALVLLRFAIAKGLVSETLSAQGFSGLVNRILPVAEVLICFRESITETQIDQVQTTSPDVNQFITEKHQQKKAEECAPVWPSDEKLSDFESAYHDLTVLMSPVTATSLRDTQEPGDRDGVAARGIRNILGGSVAARFSRRLTSVTVFFLILAVWGSVLDIVDGPVADQPAYTTREVLQIILQSLLPFTYGGIGACVYLPRSLHKYIYSRSFDRYREAEYYNRILLGIISGGTITLVTSHIGLGNGETVDLSAKALGFIAGYNTDFLFSALERVVAAILPKIDASTVKRAETPVPPKSPAVEHVRELLQQLSSTTDEADKAVIRGLLERMGDKI